METDEALARALAEEWAAEDPASYHFESPTSQAAVIAQTASLCAASNDCPGLSQASPAGPGPATPAYGLGFVPHVADDVAAQVQLYQGMGSPVLTEEGVDTPPNDEVVTNPDDEAMMGGSNDASDFDNASED